MQVLLKLASPDAIFLATCLAMASQWRCEISCRCTAACNMPSLRVIWQLFGLAVISQSTLVLHGAIFLATCLTTLEKHPLQAAEVMLHVAVSCYNWHSFKAIHAIVAESRNELHFVRSTFCNDCRDFLKPLQVESRD